eukprot:8959974-Pyramimonas_sp.AAC.1
MCSTIGTPPLWPWVDLPLGCDPFQGCGVEQAEGSIRARPLGPYVGLPGHELYEGRVELGHRWSSPWGKIRARGASKWAGGRMRAARLLGSQ